MLVDSCQYCMEARYKDMFFIYCGLAIDKEIEDEARVPIWCPLLDRSN